MSFLGFKPKIPVYLAVWWDVKRSYIIVTASVLHRKDIRRRTWCVHTEIFTKTWFLVLRYVYPMNFASRKFTSNDDGDKLCFVLPPPGQKTTRPPSWLRDRNHNYFILHRQLFLFFLFILWHTCQNTSKHRRKKQHTTAKLVLFSALQASSRSTGTSFVRPTPFCLKDLRGSDCWYKNGEGYVMG